MKNKVSSSSQDSLLFIRKIDSNLKSFDLLNKNNPQTSAFFKKTASLIKNSPALFKDSLIHPDVYFKRSLRNYEYFNTDKLKNNFKLRNTCSEALEQASKPVKLNKKKRLKLSKSKVLSKEKTNAKAVKSDSHLKYQGCAKKVVVVDLEEDAFYSPTGDFNLQSPGTDTYFDAEDKLLVASGDWFAEPDKKMAEEGEETPGEEGEDIFQGTEELVQQVEEELNEVVDDNPELNNEDAPDNSPAESPDDSPVEATTEDEEPPPDGGEGGGLPLGDVPSKIYEEDVMREVQECEDQCMEIYTILSALKARVGELLSKASRTEQEDKELEEKQRQLNQKMLLLEQKTRRIEMLLGKTKKPSKPPKARKYDEDMLPKVLICGMENNMPKIIVCDDKVKGGSGRRKSSTLPTRPPCMSRSRDVGVLPTAEFSVMPQFAKKLSESYCMQEKLAAENADLEGMRYKLQEDLLNKDETVESLQRKLTSLTAEMRMVVKENTVLHDKLCKIQNCSIPCSKSRGDVEEEAPKEQKPAMSCGKGKGTCPADVETRLQEYSETTQALEKQLNEMENEVKTMQNELLAVQKERLHLEQHRKLLSCPPPPSCMPPMCMQPVCPPPVCPPPSCPAPCNPGRGAAIELQLRELREQYNKLQDDYKGKLTEVSGLRADCDRFKNAQKELDDYRKLAEEKIKELEKELKALKSMSRKNEGSKEQLMEQEQQLNVAKQRYREVKDELEEVRALVEDQQNQLDDYRNKYLQAQQQVEEQRRQIDMMELENNRVSEQVNLEIQRVKNQFQEKLQELTPLPDILKTTQLKLQEAQQMHLLAERNNEALVRELQAYRDKAAAMANQMEKVRSDQQLGADEKATLTARIEELEARLNELTEANSNMQHELVRLEEVADDAEKRAQEKLHQIAQLEAEIENVREESARQVARTKDRCETVRRSMQNQISDLERQLAQSRAQARQAQKDRDEIRQKMQAQINNLNENFEDAQMRIRNLQGHVNFLKSSYTNVFPGGDPMLMGDSADPCNCGNNF